ncbi:hypothetical protein FPQ18DRAFT_389784 [Pyronema domesticum]|nr:hypothetical protein FPQ18DRAFT_389784 [Pyronema domesticum]
MHCSIIQSYYPRLPETPFIFASTANGSSPAPPPNYFSDDSPPKYFLDAAVISMNHELLKVFINVAAGYWCLHHDSSFPSPRLLADVEPAAPRSPVQGPPAKIPRRLDLADNNEKHPDNRAARQPDQLEEPENIDDADSGEAELSAAVPTDHDDPHHLPPPAPPARKWARTDEYYDAHIQAQREHMLSLGWNWEDNADCKAYKTYRRSVRRLETLPRFHLEKMSLNLSICKEAAKVWVEDVSDDIAIRTDRVEA